MIEIIAIRLSGGAGHEHIIALQWRNTQSGVIGQSSRQQIVEWLEDSNANQAVVARNGGWVYVGVCRPTGHPAYVRTYADREWTDNLLALPSF